MPVFSARAQVCFTGSESNDVGMCGSTLDSGFPFKSRQVYFFLRKFLAVKHF